MAFSGREDFEGVRWGTMLPQNFLADSSPYRWVIDPGIRFVTDGVADRITERIVQVRILEVQSFGGNLARCRGIHHDSGWLEQLG